MKTFLFIFNDIVLEAMLIVNQQILTDVNKTDETLTQKEERLQTNPQLIFNDTV